MKRISSYLLTTAGVAACAIAGGAASDPGSNYYQNLKKPTWNPPNEIFPVVWTTLYADIALTSGHALSKLRTEGKKKEACTYTLALATNLTLNATWSYSFFQSKNLPLATGHAAALALSSIDLTRRTAKISKLAGLSLAPYAAWTSFATVLSGKIWQLNP